jgi:hypothetical protein
MFRLYRTLILSVTLLANSFAVWGQGNLLTTAEKTSFESTSRYNDVLTFCNELAKKSSFARLETIAVSAEGLEIPLLVIGNPLPAHSEIQAADDRLVVYIQANIHAGEVEGKEAVQMLARDLLANPGQEIFRNLIILLCPILNADGNEKISKENRTNQVGPVNGVGVRYNGQFLDLNRDAMKLESPEITGVVTKILNTWDPAITVDCHTTNGSYHEEPVTFTWMMNPNGDRNLINFMRDEMMPAVHDHLLETYKTENLFYGEFIDRMIPDSGWISYASEPRYLVNYVGVRNRLAILNENYVYAGFKTRVMGSYYLLRAILDYASRNKGKIKEEIAAADLKRINQGSATDSFAVRYEGRPTPDLITIKAIEADTIPGVRGYWRYKQSDRHLTVTVPYIADYFPVENVKLPFAYLITVPDQEVIVNLITHGITVEKMTGNNTLEVEGFVIDDLKAEQRLNQGHYTNTVKGHVVKETREFRSGTYVVRTNQKLGNLVAYLLEPQSDDGLLLWNFFDKYLVPQWGPGYNQYPVYRLVEKNKLTTVAVKNY